MRKPAVMAGGLGLLLIMAACGGTSASSSNSAGGGSTLTIANAVPLTPWDLAAAGAGDVIQYYEPVFDSLIRLDAAGKATPNLATSWSYDSTNTVLTLKLVPGVKFTDGTALDASAVKANLLHTETGANEAAGRLKAIASVDAVDAGTVAIHLSAPDPALLTSLGDTSGMIASPKALDSKNGPIGSGPYVLDKAGTVNGSEYTYTRNKDYWNAKAFPFNKIVIKTMTDVTARLNALLSGQVDWGRVQSKTAAQVKGSGLTVTTMSESVEGLFIWDRGGKTVPALGNVKVRQALNWAFNRSETVSKLNNGLATATDQMFSPNSVAYDTSLENTYRYDPAKAKALLAEAGYPNGFTVTMPDVSTVAPDQQALMTQSLEDIGINVKIDKVPFTELFNAVQSGKYPMSWFKLSSANPWALVQFQLLKNGVWNPTHYSDPTLDALLTQAQHASGAAQDALFKQVNAYTQQQAFNAPWDVLQVIFGNSKRITATPQAGEAATPIYFMTPSG
jgi:peptide/nickel transport system substrate-binding protein